MTLQHNKPTESFQDYLRRRFSESLGLTPDDIDELSEDLRDWGISDSKKFEKHLLLASKQFEGIMDKASDQYATLHNLDPSLKYYEALSIIDYEDYLFFFDGDF